MHESNACPCCDSAKYPIAQVNFPIAKLGSSKGFTIHHFLHRRLCLDCLLFAFNCIQDQYQTYASNVRLLERLDERAMNLRDETKEVSR